MRSMTEKLVMIGMIAFYAIMMVICLWCLWCIYKAVLEIIRETIIDFEEGKYEGEEEKEENGGSGTLTRGTELQRSNGRDAEKEEGEQWQKKKS